MQCGCSWATGETQPTDTLEVKKEGGGVMCFPLWLQPFNDRCVTLLSAAAFRFSVAWMAVIALI